MLSWFELSSCFATFTSLHCKRYWCVMRLYLVAILGQYAGKLNTVEISLMITKHVICMNKNSLQIPT